MSLRKPGKGTRQPHGRGTPLACILAGKRTRIGSSGARVCIAIRKDGQPCGALALKGVLRCQYHGGLGSLAVQAKAQKARELREL